MKSVTFRRNFCVYNLSIESRKLSRNYSYSLMNERTLFENFLKLTDQWNAFKEVSLPASHSTFIRNKTSNVDWFPPRLCFSCFEDTQKVVRIKNGPMPAALKQIFGRSCARCCFQQYEFRPPNFITIKKHVFPTRATSTSTISNYSFRRGDC